MNAPRLFLAIALLGFACQQLHSQLVADGATVTLVSSTNITGDVTVGTNGSFTLLTLSNDARVTNSVNGIIGLNTSAKSNEVRLVSPSARWIMDNHLFVGSNGASSRLVVSNGARVENFDGILAQRIVSSNNVALITGGGSHWTNRGDVTVGFSGHDNLMVVSNGGFVSGRFGYLGRQIGASNNLVLVTGNGSIWSNLLDLQLGLNDRSNRLVIDNGGMVICSYGMIGGSSAASNNEALVTAPGSLWSNRFFLTIGDVAGRNRMVVSNGGAVVSANGILGNLSPAPSNQVIVTGSGSVWHNEESVALGGSSSGNRVDVSDGGGLECNEGYVGQDSSANNNTVVLTGSGSRWNTLANLYVGYNGSGNALIVTNGATAFTAHLFYLGYNSGAGSNLLTVAGSGSTFTNLDYFFVGQSGAGNRLVVSNGAIVRAGGGFIGIGLNSSASNNVAMVSGENSRLIFNSQSGQRMDLGRFGRNNQLVVTGGGQVSGPVETLIGFDSTGNRALVLGTNSAWTGGSFLVVGQNGNDNQLLISNRAMVTFSTNLLVGELSASTNNRLVVDDSSLFVTNAANSAVLEVRRGTNVFNGGLINVDRLVVTNSLGWFDFNGGNLVTRGAVISNDAALSMGSSATNPAIWTVLPGAGDHGLDVPLFVGATSPFNQLLINNGARMLSSRLAVVGLNNAASNSVTISGPGSRWLLTDLYVGYSGNGCRVVVTNGGFLGANYTTVGGEGSTTNCEAIITGSGSVMSNYFWLQIGSTGSSNQVRIVEGGTLLGTVQVGRTKDSVGNLLSVIGAGSRVDTRTNLEPISVGYDGAASRMGITDGGAVFGYIGELGRNLSSSNNLALVTGAGSLWSNVSDLFVGRSGAGNRLYVTNGGTLFNYNGFLGGNTYSSNNQAWVSGPGSTWTNYRELSVGLNGIGNQLIISNGATVFTFANKYVGNNDGALSNTVVVTDPGSAWLGNDSLYVGSDGSFNRLLVRNGGRVVNGLGTVGGLFAANSNQVLVTDGGSVWTNQQELTVGDNGSGNTLVVSNAATVLSASSGFIGRGSGGSSNLVILTGLGTRWLISSNLYLGSNGAFNRLVISDGAYVANVDCTVGGALSSSNNEVVITGSGTLWTNQEVLYLGVSGRGNRLLVSDGARLRSNLGYVGDNFSSSNNQAILVGPGTFWEMPNSLIFGSQSSGNRLVVSNGAAMSTDGAYVGASDLCSNNLAVITGAGSAWTNTGPMYVGYFSPANLLMITNGGLLVSTRIITVGNNSFAPANRVIIAGGRLIMTTEALDIQRGTNVLDAGVMELKQLLVTNTLGFLEFNGGELISSATMNSNGRGFVVGNGTNAANFQLRGGIHSFASGLSVASNGWLTGSGTVLGVANVVPGGTLSPGTSFGVLVFTNPPVLQGSTLMQVSRHSEVLTNDQIRITGPLTYGGSLVVSNAGPAPLVSGDKFSLFSAAAFSGTFTSIVLPPLAVGLQWTNKLSVDGSIEVIPYVPAPVTLGIVRSNGTLLVSWPTNGADYCLETTFDLSPPASWKTVSSGIATNGGSFLFTLAAPGQSAKQFFRLAFPCSQSPVTLTLQANGNLMAVSWASNSFRLETALSLLPPVSWQPINAGITDSNGLRTFTFTNNAAVSNQFFRLASP